MVKTLKLYKISKFQIVLHLPPIFYNRDKTRVQMGFFFSGILVPAVLGLQYKVNSRDTIIIISKFFHPAELWTQMSTNINSKLTTISYKHVQRKEKNTTHLNVHENDFLRKKDVIRWIINDNPKSS